MKKSILLILSFLLISCVSKYTRSNYNYDQITSAINGVMKLNISYEYKQKDSQNWQKGIRTGAVISLGDGYIIGLKHCFNVNNLKVNSPFGIITLEVESRNVKPSIGNESLEIVGSFNDIILFHSNFAFNNPYPHKWTNSNDFRIGDKVIVAGWPYMIRKNLRVGVISDTDPSGYPVHVKNTFVISVDCTNGDSGAPVLVVRRGFLEVAGLVQKIDPKEVLTFALKSNYVLKVVEKIKTKFMQK